MVRAASGSQDVMLPLALTQTKGRRGSSSGATMGAKAGLEAREQPPLRDCLWCLWDFYLPSGLNSWFGLNKTKTWGASLHLELQGTDCPFLAIGSLLEPCTELFIHEKVFGEWKQEDHEFKVTFCYSLSSRPVWASWDVMSVYILQNCETSHLMKPTDLIWPFTVQK